MAATTYGISATVNTSTSSASFDVEDRIGQTKSRFRELTLINLSDVTVGIGLNNQTVVLYADDILHIPPFGYRTIRFLGKFSYIADGTGKLEISGEGV